MNKRVAEVEPSARNRPATASPPAPDAVRRGRARRPLRTGSVLVLAALLLATPAPAEDEVGFVPLFNGRDLAGWEGPPGAWWVEDGVITAESTPEKPCLKHHYLIWRGGEPADFDLRLEYRLTGGNSGVQFRSLEIEGWDTRGYQADFEAGERWTGALFEHGRKGLALRGEKVVIAADGAKEVAPFADAAELQKLVRPDDWNEYRIVARGPEIQLFINGALMSHAVDRETGKAAARGILALQMHPGPPMKVQFRNLRLKEFAPAAAATPAEKLHVAKGFHVELLYSPAKETEGSWVSLCADPKGRLIASGQYDEGLFRVTPPPPGGDAAATRVERIAVDLSSAQGLCWAFDSLYALVSQNAKTPSGLYRVRDSDGDDRLDQVELLRPLEGRGDHGWHAILPGPDGKSLCAVAGNNTTPPALAGSRVPPHWSEDHLLPRLPDARGHMKGVLAPGGVIYRVSPDGKDWEILAHGFRNTYDAAFNREGDLFTYDADMEWDVGTPWYRPTRICHAVSGAEFGWRNGAGKWPSSYPDSLPSALDIGPGSPTGVAFGYDAKFPPRYRDSLFVADWTYGRLYAVHLRPDGATYRGESEVFLSGIPLPVADIVAHPADGALYFITGGWRTQTGLYRVTHGGGEDAGPAAEPAPDPASETLQSARRKLESFHGRRDAGAIEAVWPFLGHDDRFLRFAARVALEWQDPAAWRERALAEKTPRAALTALVALARTGARDEFHRKPDDATPDPALQPRLLAALDRLDWATLDAGARVDLLRAYALAFTRLGPPDDATRARLLARVEPWFPAGDRAIDGELCQTLVFLRSARVVPLALPLIAKAPTQEEQLDYVKSLRLATAGWTPELRREYFSWFPRAAAYHGGASFAGFVQMVKNDATANLGEAELAALKDVLEAPPPASPAASYGAALAGRTQATDWTMAALAPALAGGLRGRDFERGRSMFGATGCFLCHRFAGEGGAVGPDLTLSAGRFSPAELLESILDPGKTVSDLYGNMVIAKRGGETVVGRVVYLREDAVMVNPNMFNPAETVLVDRKEVVSMEPSKVSPMPAGLLSMLSREEILDLVAYVLSGGDSGHAIFDRGAGASP